MSTTDLVRISNLIARSLGHGHALADEEVSNIHSLRALQLRWAAKGAAINTNPGHDGHDSLEGWKIISGPAVDEGEYHFGLTHTTRSGRLMVTVTNTGFNQRVTLVFTAGPLTHGEAGRKIASIAFDADLGTNPNAEMLLEVDPSLLVDRSEGEEPVDRTDRLSLLWQIDRALDGLIFQALEARTEDGFNAQTRIAATHILAALIQLGVQNQPALPEANDIASLMQGAASNGGLYTP